MARIRHATLVTVAMLAGVACGAPEQHAAMPTVAAPDATNAAPPDAMVAITPDADLDHAAAVPLPEDDAPLPIEEIDTTVREADLVARPAPKQTRLSRSGRQLVALVERGEDHRIMLAVVEDNNGIVASFPLAVADGSTELHGFDGNTYSPVDRWGATGGPIIFAIRVRPTAKAAWQQLVVFAAGRTLRVVTRTLGDTLWRPLLDVQLDAGATFVGIGTTDPH